MLTTSEQMGVQMPFYAIKIGSLLHAEGAEQLVCYSKRTIRIDEARF